MPALPGGVPTTFQFYYDSDTQLIGATLAGADGSNVASYGYAYDPVGNRTAEQINGNLNPATFNNLNQIGPPFTYDADGSVLGDGARTLEWDAEDRLTAVSTGTHRSEFTYDGMSRRTRIVEKESGIVMNDKRLIWCGSSICEERDAVAGLTKRFFRNGETQTANGATTAYFYTRDKLASVREMTDSSGNVVASYDYDPWGRANKLSGSTIDAAFGYAGYYVHAPSGLYLTQYRAYDPNFGRWVSRDPIGEAGGVNLYAYADNDPVNVTDPLGLEGGFDPVINWFKDPKNWFKALTNFKQPWKPFIKPPSASPLPTEQDAPEGALKASLGLLSVRFYLTNSAIETKEKECPDLYVWDVWLGKTKPDLVQSRIKRNADLTRLKNELRDIKNEYDTTFKWLREGEMRRGNPVKEYHPPGFGNFL